MRKVFITGVSSGLGYGLAKVFLEQKFEVYGCSRRVPDDLVREGLIHVSIDLANEEEGSAALTGMLANVNHFDLVLLNAAKLGKIRDMVETPLEDLRETMEINVMANKWLLDTLFAHDRTVDQVVAISSGASISGSRGWNGYSLSKAALNMLIKLYAGERPKTHFISLAPGLIESEMQDYLTALPADDRYAPLEILKAAKGTDKMPDGATCAHKIMVALPKLRELESGSYADIRKL
ncbi:MAG: SDR family NAD(P)-dependent oxidoreductase [Verrucomicrobiota bacterium]